MFVANKPQLCCQQMIGLLATNGAFVGNKRPLKRRFASTKRRFTATKRRFSLTKGRLTKIFSDFGKIRVVDWKI
jgi:hypothetical protein